MNDDDFSFCCTRCGSSLPLCRCYDAEIRLGSVAPKGVEGKSSKGVTPSSDASKRSGMLRSILIKLFPIQGGSR